MHCVSVRVLGKGFTCFHMVRRIAKELWFTGLGLVRAASVSVAFGCPSHLIKRKAKGGGYPGFLEAGGVVSPVPHIFAMPRSTMRIRSLCYTTRVARNHSEAQQER